VVIALFPTRQIALTLGPISIHWYGLMYVLGFLVGLPVLKRLLKYRDLSFTEKQIESLVLHVFFGVIVGGRLGFVLFYGGMEYLAHPLEIFKVWNGGMASHGGFIGVILGLLIYTRGNMTMLLKIADVLAVPIALGLMFGRLGNLINGELYGTVTTLPWGMHFPGAEGLRHPTQIYAMLKDITIATVCFFHLRRTWPQERPGSTIGVFLCMYAVLRFLVEVFRDQPLGYTNIFGVELSRGQLLTLPLFALGILVLLYAYHRKRV
jgi:phosphatidylglycerol:prolipoprotein diacylglycerol transferase